MVRFFMKHANFIFHIRVADAEAMNAGGSDSLVDIRGIDSELGSQFFHHLYKNFDGLTNVGMTAAFGWRLITLHGCERSSWPGITANFSFKQTLFSAVLPQ